MLPNVAGEKHTRLQMVLYSVPLAIVGVLPWVLGFANLAYGVIAIILGAIFVWRAVQVWQKAGSDNMLAEKKLFKFSILYLFLLFAALLLKPLATLVGL